MVVIPAWSLVNVFRLFVKMLDLWLDVGLVGLFVRCWYVLLVALGDWLLLALLVVGCYL